MISLSKIHPGPASAGIAPGIARGELVARSACASVHFGGDKPGMVGQTRFQRSEARDCEFVYVSVTHIYASSLRLRDFCTY